MSPLASRPAAVAEFRRMRSLGFSPLSAMQAARCVGVYERNPSCSSRMSATEPRFPRDRGAMEWSW